ncbi:MAG: EAL domain-containing protein [Polyangiaceae bacterium]|nr:EAL domain-containing protein [Polyangiaceae bacterium]
MNTTVRPSAPRNDGEAGETRVLLVEDDPALSRGLCRVLQRRGFAVDTAADGVEAMRHLMAAKFDVVVSDIHVPGVSGVDILRMIRTYALDVPVILMTGDPSVETAIEAVNLGAAKYLVKPVDGELLEAEVTRASQLNRLARLKREALSISGEHAEAPSDQAGLSARFDRALEDLWLAFQPIVSLKNNELFGYEALMRSKEPSLPGPLDVLEAAQRLGAIRRLGSRVRGLAAQAFEKIQDPAVVMFVNVHPEELQDPDLYEGRDPLTKFASRVVLEVTERATIGNVHDVHARASVLRFMDFRLAIDDLGQGYAGLTSFVTLEPDIVKLDMSLIRGIDEDVVKQKVVSSLVSLCRDMGLLLVAEGVETRAEMDMVRKLGCTLAQGYFVGRPNALFAAA